MSRRDTLLVACPVVLGDAVFFVCYIRYLLRIMGIRERGLS